MTSGGQRRIVLSPAPSTSRPRSKARWTTRSRRSGRLLFGLPGRAPVRCRSSGRARARRPRSGSARGQSRMRSMQVRAHRGGVLDQFLLPAARWWPARRRRPPGCRRRWRRARPAARSSGPRAPRWRPAACRWRFPWPPRRCRARRRNARRPTSCRCAPCRDCTSSKTSRMPFCSRHARQLVEEFLRRHDVAALALHRFHHDGGGFFGGRDGLEQGVFDVLHALHGAGLGLLPVGAAIAVWDTARAPRRASAGRSRRAARPCAR